MDAIKKGCQCGLRIFWGQFNSQILILECCKDSKCCEGGGKCCQGEIFSIIILKIIQNIQRWLQGMQMPELCLLKGE
jgi:hypothetical protein